MYKLACADLGAADCSFVSVGATAHEAVMAMMEHAVEAHPDKMAEMDGMTPEEVQDMMMAKVTESDEVSGEVAS